ncbi:hypothetical protein GCM10028868_33450 [Virgibacillus kimchii]
MDLFASLVIFSVHIGRMPPAYTTGQIAHFVFLFIHCPNCRQALVYGQSGKVLDVEKIDASGCAAF